MPTIENNPASNIVQNASPVGVSADIAGASTTNNGTAPTPPPQTQAVQTEQQPPSKLDNSIPESAKPSEIVGTVQSPEKLDATKTRYTYVQMLNALNPQPTEEELAKERKKEKREKIIAAIGDGISSLANLYFASKGAKSTFDPQNSLSAKAKERWDKVNELRKTQKEKYDEQYLKAAQADDAWAAQQEGLKRKDIEAKIKQQAEDRKQAEDKRKNDLWELQMKRQQGLIDIDEYKKESARIQAEYQESYQQSRINKNNRTNIGGSGKGNAAKKYAVYDKNGNVIDHVYTKTEAASLSAKNGYEYPSEVTETERTRESNGNKRHSSSTVRGTSTKRVNVGGSTGGGQQQGGGTMPGVTEEKKEENTMPGVK